MVLVAAAVIREGGKVLLTRRKEDAHLGGYWEFPGGKLEPGEGPEEAVVRECEEECGLVVQVVDILDVTFHRYPGKDVLLHFYDCRIVSGTVQHLGVTEHVWCAPEDLDRYPLPPADQKLIGKIRALAPAP